jgi:SSS family solute:Na+ symporter
VAAGIRPGGGFGANVAVPALFDRMFPPWFSGFALASIAIGALVPAAMMAIAAANLFARNIYAELIRPDASPARQTKVSKIASLFMKVGAVGFVVRLPTTFVINFQLAAGVWILQTLPAVFLAVFWRRLHGRAVLAGWVTGTVIGTVLLVEVGFASSSYSFGWGDHHTKLFIGIPALAANLVVTAVGSLLTPAPAADDPPGFAGETVL